MKIIYVNFGVCTNLLPLKGICFHINKDRHTYATILKKINCFFLISTFIYLFVTPGLSCVWQAP